jgi:uncharacterized protein
MSLNIKVLGCNGLCGSCYENSIRTKSTSKGYDIEKILATLQREIDKIPKDIVYKYHAPCVHGGEPLLLRTEDLGCIFALSHKTFGTSSVQTNGLLLKDEHLDLFIKYKTHVGFSLDGDTAALNFGRWNALATTPLSEIEKGTRVVLDNMKRCNEANIPISVITILRKYNASYNSLPALKKFLLRLYEKFNCPCVRTNEGIVYDVQRFSQEQLSAEELGYAYTYLADVCLSNADLIWEPYRDVVDLLLGYRDQTCIFGECDPWKTSSETTIDEEGNIGSCLKTGGSIDGLNMLAAGSFSRERYNVLQQLSQENGGCKDCNYWNICKGGCPGAGIDNDWRSRTRFCEGWKMLFNHVARKILGLAPNVNISSSLPGLLMDPSISLANLSPEGSSWKKEKRVDLKEREQRK